MARIAIADRVNYCGGVFRQPSAIVRRRQCDADGVVSALLELRRDEMPVPGTAAGAGHENECGALQLRLVAHDHTFGTSTLKRSETI